MQHHPNCTDRFSDPVTCEECQFIAALIAEEVIALARAAQ